MEPITIREYAKSIGISYQAVRTKVNRYSEELDGHITVVNRTSFLDEFAVQFLNQHRNTETVRTIVEHEDADALKNKIISLQDQILSMQNLVIELNKEKNSFLLESIEFKEMRLDFEALKEATLEKERELERLRTENASLYAELEKERQAKAENEKKKWWKRFFIE